MQEWRRNHPLNPIQKKKDNARSYANVYLKRLKITKKPCEKCGSVKSEMHHQDYTKPLLVEWLCRTCHLNLHKLNYKTLLQRVKNEALVETNSMPIRNYLSE
jgi:hypothetical protein